MPSRRICVIKQLKAIADNLDIYKIVRDRFQCEAATLETLSIIHRDIKPENIILRNRDRH